MFSGERLKYNAYLSSSFMKNIAIHYADDDQDDLELFKQAVKTSRLPVSLHTYNKSDEFIKGLKQDAGQNPIVFLDVNMPGKSGFELLKEMRSTQDIKDLPVVMFSTSNDPKVINVSKDFGANLYAVKPKSFEKLKDLIRQITQINWAQFEPSADNFVLSLN